MPSTPVTGGSTAAPVEEQFLDLICRDQDLLSAEFDEIIAAEWPQPPADKPGRGANGAHPGRSAARRTADPARRPVPRPRHPGTGEWARQRSPPSRHRPTPRRKAGDRHR